MTAKSLVPGIGLLGTLAAGAQGQTRSMAHATEARPIEVELVSSSRAVVPGETAWVAVRLKPNDGWHTYWRHAGDVGSAPSVTWDLPSGWIAGALRWPAPRRISSPPLASYGYEREIILAAPIEVPRSARIDSTVRIAVRVGWVVCDVECIADDVDLSIDVLVASYGAVDSRALNAIVAEGKRTPLPQGGWTASATVDSSDLILLARPPADWRDNETLPSDFFVDRAGVINHSAAVRARWVDSMIELRIRRSEYASRAPTFVSGVLVFGNADSIGTGDNLALEIAAKAEASVSAARVALGMSAEDTTSKSARAFVTAALLGLVGGILLNLMPCVLPVLSIKLLGLVAMASRSGREAKRHALLFGSGVMLSMWSLVGILLAIRAAGTEIGWGYQLQSPVFVSLLALLMVAAALNMAGVFTIGPVGGRLVAVADRRSGALQEVMNGALVVLLATPCAAPFLSSAAGYALMHGAVSAFTVFSAIAVGLAGPVVLVAFVPSLRRLIPKPGQWMLTLRQLLVFPLFATAAWLVWVVGRQVGVDVMGALLAAMTILSLALWLFGRSAQSTSPAIRYSGVGVASLSLAFALGLAVVSALKAVAAGSAPTTGVHQSAGSGLEWQPFSDTSLRAARKSGAIVMLDVTADWCLTCKLNERIAFAPERVRAALDAANVVLIRADWTSRSPKIAQLISGFGRSGVPVVVVYPPGENSEPVLLPTLLSPALIIRTLESMPSAIAAIPDSLRAADLTPTSLPSRP